MNLPLALGAITLLGLPAPGSDQPAPASADPFAPVAFLIGTWEVARPADRSTSATMTFAWGDEQRLIRYWGTRPQRDAGSVREFEGVITYDGAQQRLVFSAAYRPNVAESGRFEVHGDGAVTRHFDVTYAPGSVLPWSDGTVAGTRGTTLRFQQTWTMQDEQTLHGEFLMERNGVWSRPDFGGRDPEDPIVWRRVDANDPTWRDDLEFRTGGSGTWLTSNAAYRTEAESTEFYGMRYESRFGGTSIRGCLWSEAGGEVTGVAWEFFAAWDPADGLIWLHQAGADGTVGVGYEIPGHGSSVQTFTTPAGDAFRVRHLVRHVGRDTMETDSFDWTEGAWTPRRTYTWVRQASRERAPC